MKDELLMQEKAVYEEYFNTLLYDNFKKPLGNNSSLYEYYQCFKQINFIIRPECNQQCEYCYLYKHGDELYPDSYTNESVLENLNLFLDYLYNNKKVFPWRFELFAGDLFFDDIFFDIMDMFEKYFINIQNKYPEFFNKNSMFKQNEHLEELLIIIPSNLSFVYYHPEKAKKVIEYYNYFLEKYDVRIMFSWSTDGLYAANSREKKELTQDYFDTILDFCIKTKTGFHPMVAPENIKYWKENYDWWLSMCKKLNEGTLVDGAFQPMMLEVRNGYWTDENIDDYCSFLDYLMEKRFEFCNNSVEKLTQHLINNEKLNIGETGYDPIGIHHSSGINAAQETPGCGLFTGFHFNCTNLSLVLCHRLSYKHLTTVYYIPNEEKTKIIDIKPHNMSLFMAVHNLKYYNLPVCAECDFVNNCLQGCFGSQFEDSGEIFLPIPNVCNFFKTKYTHVLELYEKYGIFDFLEKHPNFETGMNIKEIIRLKNKLLFNKNINEKEKNRYE